MTRLVTAAAAPQSVRVYGDGLLPGRTQDQSGGLRCRVCGVDEVPWPRTAYCSERCRRRAAYLAREQRRRRAHVGRPRAEGRGGRRDGDQD